MSELLAALRSVDLGKSVAEKDKGIDGVFVETSAYDALMRDKYDIIEGDKGTGKTALFIKLLSEQTSDRRETNTIVVRGCNVKGEPFFQELTKFNTEPEEEYIRLWKAYILARTGNLLLKNNRYVKNSKSPLSRLHQLLKGLDLLSEEDAKKDDIADARDLFNRVLHKIGNLFRWKSVGVSLDVTAEGISFSPKIEFADGDEIETDVSIQKALSLLDKCLADLGKSVWVAIDRLDEAFQGFPDAEVPALRGLFRTYRDLDEFENISLKIFVRRDLFAKIIVGGFVNLTHINSSKLTLVWQDEDLKTLICNRVRRNSKLCELMSICKEDDDRVISQMFPAQMGTGTVRVGTWEWIISRVCDGNSAKPPRNLIDLVEFAIGHQVERDSKRPRNTEDITSIIDFASLEQAAISLSKRRLEDTLFSESPKEAHIIKLFRNGSAMYDKKALFELMDCPSKLAEDQIQRLVFMGFLEERGRHYVVPHLYRAGLEIKPDRS